MDQPWTLDDPFVALELRTASSQQPRLKGVVSGARDAHSLSMMVRGHSGVSLQLSLTRTEGGAFDSIYAPL